jgi:hypothetical protein
VLAFGCLILSSYAAEITSENDRNADIIAKCNKIIENIYNDIWRVRNNYAELEDFGPQDYSDTKEVASQFKAIRSIRIKSVQSEKKKGGIFNTYGLAGEKDILNICFSESNKAFATRAKPTFNIFVKDVGFYILVYSTSDDNFFNHEIISIVKKNAVVTEE